MKLLRNNIQKLCNTLNGFFSSYFATASVAAIRLSSTV